MAQTPDGMDKTLLSQTQSQPVYSMPPGLPKEPVNYLSYVLTNLVSVVTVFIQGKF